jgi:hypothetical protein
MKKKQKLTDYILNHFKFFGISTFPISKVNRFLSNNMYSVRFSDPKKTEGSPSNSFHDKPTTVKFSFAKEAGIFPERQLCETDNTVKEFEKEP